MTDGTTDTLNEYSEVQDLLTRTGFGSLAGQADVRKLPGRNHNWIGTTDAGERVFVKKLEGPAEASAARIRQCVTFDRILRSGAAAELLSPRLLAADTEASVLVFACVDEARTLRPEPSDHRTTYSRRCCGRGAHRRCGCRESAVAGAPGPAGPGRAYGQDGGGRAAAGARARPLVVSLRTVRSGRRRRYSPRYPGRCGVRRGRVMGGRGGTDRSSSRCL